MIVNIDDNMGRLMKQLQEWDLEENTLLIFMTDNGQASRNAQRNGERYPIFTAGFRSGKGSPYEGGTRVPAFWRWKNVLPEGQDIDALTAHIDLFDTFVELADATVSDGIQERDGRSFLSLLEDPASNWSDRYLFVHKGRWPKGAEPNDFKFADCAVRGPRFRLVNNSELYDVTADPGETTNVIEDHPEVVADMRAAYDEWWSNTRPLMVNADAPNSPERPFWVLYEAQVEGSGIPQWEAPEF